MNASKKNNLEKYFFLFLLILAFYGSFIIFRPFIMAIMLAFIFSQLFNNWYKKLLSLFKNESLASLFSCFLIILLFLVPIIFISSLTLKETTSLIENFNQEEFIEKLNNFELNLPSLGVHITGKNFQTILGIENFSVYLKALGNFIFDLAKKTYQETASFLFMTFVMIFSLYYLFKDQQKLIKKIIKLSPLKTNQENEILKRFMEISRATLKGSLVIAIIQGFLVTLSFLITDVSAPFLWGLIAAVFSLVPLLGAFLVWAPAGIFLLIWGNTWKGLFILLFGILIISTIDNLLRPKLVEKNCSIHPLLIFLSTLGGLVSFGMLGFLIGPVIIVFLITLLDIYEKKIQN